MGGRVHRESQRLCGAPRGRQGVGGRARASRQRPLRANHEDSGGAIAQEGGPWHATGPRGARLHRARVHRERQRLCGAPRGRVCARAQRANGRCGPATTTPGELLRRVEAHGMPRDGVVPASADHSYKERNSCSRGGQGRRAVAGSLQEAVCTHLALEKRKPSAQWYLRVTAMHRTIKHINRSCM